MRGAELSAEQGWAQSKAGCGAGLGAEQGWVRSRTERPPDTGLKLISVKTEKTAR